MSTKALKKELLVAVVMLLVAAVALSGSTYAWFAMNTQVTVTGMEVRTTTGDNLLIATGTTEATAKPAETEFKTSLVQLVDGLLEPASTVNGVNYFYTSTKNVQGNGDAASEVYVAYDPSNTTPFDDNYSTTGAKAFVDYAFFLKASNSDATNAKDVKLTKLDLTYGGSAQTQKAFRIAVFVDDMGETGATPAQAPFYTAVDDTNLLSILRVSGAGYFSATNKAVNSTTTLAEVDGKIDDAVTIGTVAAEKTNYYKVVVRLWLEGEDTTCTNDTFATLKDKWALDLALEIGGSASAVSVITPATTAAKTELTDGVTTATSNPATNVIIDETTYYEISGVMVGGTLKAYTTKTTALAAGDHIFTITNNYPTMVDNQIDWQ